MFALMAASTFSSSTSRARPVGGPPTAFADSETGAVVKPLLVFCGTGRAAAVRP